MVAFSESLSERIQRQVCLAPFTTFKIGGPADSFLQVETESEFIEAVELAHSNKTPFFLLGGGSNLVISDEGIRGLVIRNKARDRIEINKKSCLLSVSSGATLGDVVSIAQVNGLAGMETLAGIPGSIGGAVYGNAGAFGKCIGDILVGADILTADGRVCRVGNPFFEFIYRSSSLKELPVYLLNATFQLIEGKPDDILATERDICEKRRGKHPPEEVGSAGSFFKNLPPEPGETRRRAAGELLEKAGAKEMSCGGASVYSKHANFIVNYGKASAKDVHELALMLKEKVRENFGIQLYEEVRYVGW